ncbi:MAG: hypothetical protein Q8O24_08260 [Gallionellaceae bacterium]|nr:hypothetical protein [Gallionellaceae bacterium]
MLSRIVLLSIGCALLNTALAATSDIRLSNNQINLQSISTKVGYTETNSTGVLDTEDGPVSGFAVSLSSMRNGWIKSEYLYADYDYSKGRTRYIGAYINGGGGYGSVVSTSGAVLSNYSFRYGKGLTLNNSTMLTPFAEFGHHYWDRGVNYGEIYTHYYYGLGGLLQYSPSQSFVLSLNGLMGNTQNSYIKVMGGGGGDYGFAGPLGNSPVARVGLSADFRVDDNIYAKLSVERTRFSYGKSAVYYTGTGYFLEPDSSTSYTIVKFGLGHTF